MISTELLTKYHMYKKSHLWNPVCFWLLTEARHSFWLLKVNSHIMTVFMCCFDLCHPIRENVKCEQSLTGRDPILVVWCNRKHKRSCEQNCKAHSHGVTKTATAIDWSNRFHWFLWGCSHGATEWVQWISIEFFWVIQFWQFCHYCQR